MDLSVLFLTNIHVDEREGADHFEFDRLEASLSHSSQEDQLDVTERLSEAAAVISV